MRLNRRELRRAIPQPLRQRLYDWTPSRRRRWREVPGVTHIPAPAKVALSFDDGPDERCTPMVLDALARVGATATFFVIGERVLKHPTLVQEIRARGHELGVHGMTHRRHDLLPEEEARAELLHGIEAIQDACGWRPQRYRPPFGAASPQLASISNELGLQLTYWSAWGQDWDEISASRIAHLVIRDLDVGAVVLLHDSALYAQRDDATATVESIPLIAQSAYDRGLELVSLAAAFN